MLQIALFYPTQLKLPFQTKKLCNIEKKFLCVMHTLFWRIFSLYYTLYGILKDSHLLIIDHR